MPVRYDQSLLGEFERTPQGGLRIPARPTRTGVLSYRLPDGTTRRELRPAEEVFAPASLASLVNAPVTDLHPEQDGIRIPVTPDNYQALTMGHVSNDVRQDGDHVASTLLIQAGSMIRQIEARRRSELSCGYDCDLEFTPGVTSQGEIYDAIQRGILYNHVAIGPENWGRAGATVALCLRHDSGDGIQLGKDDHVKETIGGVEYIVGSAEHTAAKAAQTQIQKLTGERDLAVGRADTADRTLVKVKADLVTATDPAIVSAAIQKRAKIVTDCARAARKFGIKFDDKAAAGADESSLIAAAVAMMDPSLDLTGKTPDYIAGVFETLISQMIGGPGADDTAEQATDANKDINAATPGANPPAGSVPNVQPRTDANASPIFGARSGNRADSAKTDPKLPDPDKARTDSEAKGRNAWKEPLSTTRRKPV